MTRWNFRLAPRPPTLTTWYCRWGMPYAKPTDLWTNIGGDWPACHNGNPDHDAQSRYHEVRKALGQDGGVQTFKRRPNGRIDTRYVRDALYSKDRAAARGLIPPALSLAVAIACETDGIIRPQPVELAS